MKKKVSVKNKIPIIIGSLIVISLILGNLYLVLFNKNNDYPIRNLLSSSKEKQNEDLNRNPINNIGDQDQNLKNNGETTDVPSGISGGVVGSGGGGGSSGGAGGAGGTQSGSQDSKSSCSFQQIPYTILNPYKTETCTLFDSNDINKCLEKRFECYVKVKNLDYMTNGVFEIELLFVKNGNIIEDNFYSSSLSQNINPREIKTFTSSSSTSDIDIINSGVNCYYKTLSVPKKEVCL